MVGASQAILFQVSPSGTTKIHQTRRKISGLRDNLSIRLIFPLLKMRFGNKIYVGHCRMSCCLLSMY